MPRHGPSALPGNVTVRLQNAVFVHGRQDRAPLDLLENKTDRDRFSKMYGEKDSREVCLGRFRFMRYGAGKGSNRTV
jgi:hypothetical protein